MFNFFEKIGRFIVRLMIIVLILLISIQLVMNNEATYTKLQEIETVVRNIFSNPSNVIQVTQPVDQNTVNESYGVITFDLLQNLSLPQVWIRCNGEKVDNFSRGVVSIRVKKGDFLTIDSTLYKKSLWFEITSKSPVIRNFEIGQQFRTSGTMLNIGVVNVELNNKL